MDLLVPGVYAQLADAPAHGATNAAAVVDEDGITVVDTLMVPSQYEPFAAAVEALGAPIRRVVLTSSNIEFCGGTPAFRLAGIYGRPQASAHLDQPADVEVFRRLHPAYADEFLDEEGVALTRPVSHVIDAPVQLTPALAVVPLTGQQEENLVAVLPGPSVVLAGAMCAFGVTPNAAQGDPGRWAAELDRLVALAPIVVPGHGPVGGEEEVRELQAYLRACVDAEGDASRLADGPWQGWTGAAEWDPVNVERAALLAEGRDEPPSTLLRRLGLGN